jgi:hypothetical protein
MPEPASPFEDEICVYRAGDHACPSGYRNKRSYSASLNDERECEPCTCIPSGICSANYTLYNHPQCTVDAPDYTSVSIGQRLSGACSYNNPGISVVAMRLTSVNAPGNCSPSSAKSVGEILAEDPITVCCE